jgi:hypothetical protein
VVYLLKEGLGYYVILNLISVVHLITVPILGYLPSQMNNLT